MRKQSSLKKNLVNCEETKTKILERRNQRNQAQDLNRQMADPQAPQPNLMEQCLVALTNILNRQAQPPSLRNRIEKEIRHLPTFEGRPGTLPAFIITVDRVLTEYGQQQLEAYNVIYNEKILGPAKNYLETEPPTTWEECKVKLKLQYKATKDQGRIVQDINSLKVSSISELLDKIRNIVDDIAECAIFSEHQIAITNNLSSVLVLKIKEIAAGALAAEIYDKYSLQEIRVTLNKFIGQDHYNIKFCKTNQVINKPSFKQSVLRPNQDNYRQSNNQSGQHRQDFNYQNRNNHFRNQAYRNFNYQNRSDQFRNQQPNRNFNRSDQFRNPQPSRNYNQVQPMDIDNISNRNDVNQLNEGEFFINLPRKQEKST